MQDMGYYPLGSRFFSDLVHYVRAGDFVVALLDEAQDANELAFAIGALAHYAADDTGHPAAINRIVPKLYPKLKKRYGPIVTYEDSPSAHMKTEFGFDVVEVAEHRYSPDSYRNYIGFKVAKPVLERAFLKTYGIELKDTFLSVDIAIGTYRRTVSGLLPTLTKAAWAAKKDEIQKAAPGITRQKFIYTLSRASYEKEWGKDYERPGMFARFLAFLFKLLPKVGPFQAFAFKVPTPDAQRLFTESMDRTLEQYNQRVIAVRRDQVVRLPNENLDTGEPPKLGEYRLADESYAKLLDKLNSRHFKGVDPALRNTILAFYRGAKGLDPKLSEELAKLERSVPLPSARS